MHRALLAIIGRELRRMFRQRGRLVSAMVRPLIWLFVIGSGFQAMLKGLGVDHYQQFMVPGLLAMVLLFGAMLASLSMVYDKESGVMRMLIIAPFPHYWIILARTLSATVAALVQVFLLIVILIPMGYFGMPASPPLLLAGLIMTALTCAAAGMLIAVYSKTMDNFAVIMNFVIFPMFFLSGALYPVEHLPLVLKAIALANPFSYGVDLLKHATIVDAPAQFRPDLSVVVDLLVMGVFVIAALVVSCLRFSQGPVLETLARVLSGTKRS